MERTIYERADGGAAARLSAPAASQGPNCSSASRGCFVRLDGRRARREAVHAAVPITGTRCSRLWDRYVPKEGLLCQLSKNEIWFLACIDILESGHLGKGTRLRSPVKPRTFDHDSDPD